LDILNKSKLTEVETIRCSDRIYYGSYPYKVKMKGNGISYSWSSVRDIIEWQSGGDKFERRWNMKTVQTWSKIHYFKKLSVLEDFVNTFHSEVDEIYGPLNQDHVDALKIINQEQRYAEEIHVIKENYYFNEYDMKLVWKFPFLTSNSSIYSTASGYKRTLDFWEKLGSSVRDMTDNNSRWHMSNCYIKQTDLQDIEFYVKLKFGDVIDQRVKVIKIEN